MHRAAIQGTTFPVIWIDNFSKNVARQRPTISKDVFTSMMWTGVAVKLYDGTALSRELVSVNGEQITAMPPTHAPLEANFISTSRASLPFEVGQPPMRFCDSLVNRCQVCSIPPRYPSKWRNTHICNNGCECHAMDYTEPCQWTYGNTTSVPTLA